MMEEDVSQVGNFLAVSDKKGCEAPENGYDDASYAKDYSKDFLGYDAINFTTIFPTQDSQ